MNAIHFKPNEPQTLSLKETSGVMDGFYVLYELTDGKTLQLPRPAAVKLNMLDPRPGEEFSATKHQPSPRDPQEWVFSLTAGSEQLRADQETAELAKRTRQDLSGQLEASLQTKGIAAVPRKPPGKTLEPVPEPRGTGTYGPLPQVALGRQKVAQIPFNLAFREVVRFVIAELNASGEQWSEQSRQDLASTVLIAAAKAGYVGVWER